jgi:hypothetical protein
MAHDVFLSHSSKNKTAADAICHALESNGVKCWIAPRDVKPGFEYAEELINGIKHCKIFLLIFSKESNVSKPVSKEIESAFRYEKTVIPFRIEDVEMRESLEYYLSNLHWLDAFPDDKEFDSLVRAVKNALGMDTTVSKTVPAPVPEPVPPPAAQAASGWFTMLGDKQAGPFGRPQIKFMLANGKLSEDCRVKTADSDWIPISAEPELSDIPAQVWYLGLNGQNAGPFSYAGAHRYIRENYWDAASCLVWREGMNKWLPLNNCIGFTK